MCRAGVGPISAAFRPRGGTCQSRLTPERAGSLRSPSPRSSAFPKLNRSVMSPHAGNWATLIKPAFRTHFLVFIFPRFFSSHTGGRNDATASRALNTDAVAGPDSARVTLRRRTKPAHSRLTLGLSSEEDCKWKMRTTPPLRSEAEPVSGPN